MLLTEIELPNFAHSLPFLQPLLATVPLLRCTPHTREFTDSFSSLLIHTFARACISVCKSKLLNLLLLFVCKWLQDDHSDQYWGSSIGGANSPFLCLVVGHGEIMPSRVKMSMDAGIVLVLPWQPFPGQSVTLCTSGSYNLCAHWLLQSFQPFSES